MKNVTRWFVVGALAATGMLAFACGGGNSEGGGSSTPSATAPATSAAPSASTAMTATATATASATTAPTPPAPPLTVVAMKLTVNDPKNKHAFELRDDGSVLGDGKMVAKFVGAELQDKDGKSLMAVAADGSLTAMGQTKPAKFNAKDELEVGGGTIFVGDDGVVKMIGPDGKPDKDSGKIKLTGFKPQARRTATVFVMAMFMARPEPQVTASGTAGPAASVGPAASAKPASSATPAKK